MINSRKTEHLKDIINLKNKKPKIYFEKYKFFSAIFLINHRFDNFISL